MTEEAKKDIGEEETPKKKGVFGLGVIKPEKLKMNINLEQCFSFHKHLKQVVWKLNLFK